MRNEPENLVYGRRFCMRSERAIDPVIYNFLCSHDIHVEEQNVRGAQNIYKLFASPPTSDVNK